MLQSDVRWVMCTQALGLKPEGSVLFFTHALLLRTKPLTWAWDPQGTGRMEQGCAAAHDTSLFICSNKRMGLSPGWTTRDQLEKSPNGTNVTLIRVYRKSSLSKSLTLFQSNII